MKVLDIKITILGEYSTYDALVKETEEMPKTDRKYYTKVLETVKKVSNNENFYILSTGSFGGLKMQGYLFFTDKRVIFIEPKISNMKAHVYEYANYIDVDFDVIRGGFNIELNSVHLTRKTLFGKKVDKLAYLPTDKLDVIYKFLKSKI